MVMKQLGPAGFAAALAVALAGAGEVAAPAPAPPAPAVVCAVPHDLHRRVFELDRSAGGEWQLSMQSTATQARWVRLPLPDAIPAIGRDTASLSYRSAYGGRTVRLNVGPAGSSLDVYANYELEVNVDPNLDPRIDLLNTNGPLTGLSCRITPAPPR